MPFNKYGNIDHPIHQETGNFSYLSVGDVILTNQTFCIGILQTNWQHKLLYLHSNVRKMYLGILPTYMNYKTKDGLRFETDTNDTATKLF